MSHESDEVSNREHRAQVTIRIATSTVALLTATSVLVSGCDWVDSSGSQNATPSVTEVFLDDLPVNGVIVANEKGEARFTASLQSASTPEQTFTWSEEPLEQGNLAVCADYDGFKPELAAQTLEQACKLGSSCQLEIETVVTTSDEALAEFSVDIPELDASVGLLYELTIEDSEGRISLRHYNFCLIAINDGPVTQDDSFTVIEGNTLNVTGNMVNLLTNDTDDTDVSNTEFVVLPEPLIPPKFADSFTLGTDGGFAYQSSLVHLSEDGTDRFTYLVSDGLSTSEGVAIINIVAANEAPAQVATIPVLLATEGVPFSVDLAANFADPEGSDLSFTLDPATPLVTGSGLGLSAEGVLAGTPEAADVGSYQLNVQVSDGNLISTADVILEIAAAPIIVQNSAPVFVPRSVFNQSVELGQPMRPVTPQFTDVDGDTLTYSMASTSLPRLPPGVLINTTTGVVSGTPTFPGFYRGLRVRATDPSGESAVSTLFTVTVIGFR